MYDALILAGGAARRLGGCDKALLEVGGVPLLDRVLLATDGAANTVVVGPPRATVRPVRWTREEPAGGGPVAALAAGLVHITSDLVLLLAADLPFLDLVTTELLCAPLPAGQVGRLLVDESRPQWLCGAWRTDALREALVGIVVDGARLRDVLSPLAALRVQSPEGAGPPPWTDVDTEDDLRRAREGA